MYGYIHQHNVTNRWLDKSVPALSNRQKQNKEREIHTYTCTSHELCFSYIHTHAHKPMHECRHNHCIHTCTCTRACTHTDTDTQRTQTHKQHRHTKNTDTHRTQTHTHTHKQFVKLTRRDLSGPVHLGCELRLLCVRGWDEARQTKRDCSSQTVPIFQFICHNIGRERNKERKEGRKKEKKAGRKREITKYCERGLLQEVCQTNSGKVFFFLFC